MNFYIGEDIESILDSEVDDYNIRIDGDVIDCFYVNNIELKKFYDIYPYDHTLLKKDEILKLIEDCDTILSSDLIKTESCLSRAWLMGNPEVGFNKLKDLCLEALKEDKNIISIGD